MKTDQTTRIVSISSGHLTETQFGELLDGSANQARSALTPAEEHVLACEQCAAELDSLREALVLFRGAATAYADDQLRNVRHIPIPVHTLVSPVLRPMYFIAAAALLLAFFVPIQMSHQQSQKKAQQAASANAASSFERYATESNEALLEDVDHATSASVPDSMRALADPMGTADLSVQKSNQRKD